MVLLKHLIFKGFSVDVAMMLQPGLTEDRMLPGDILGDTGDIISGDENISGPGSLVPVGFGDTGDTGDILAYSLGGELIYFLCFFGRQYDIKCY
ncbi:MAG: hypothetical protein K6T65_16520 [Peptococcaceae bacterium]|nr:hypothetical protein [Peptococcaceae bacterium]